MDFCFVEEVFPYKRDGELVMQTGSGAHAFFLARELTRRGHEVRMVCGRVPGTPAKEVIDGIEFKRYGEYVPWSERPPVIGVKNALLNNVVGLRLLNEEIKRKRPDFLVAGMSFSAPRAIFLSKIHRVPFIAGVYDPNDLRLYFRHVEGTILNFLGGIYVWLYTIIPKYADLIETLLPTTIPELSDKFGIDEKKIFATGHGVDTSRYKYSEDKENLIAVVGRITPYKRVDMAIEIFRRVREEIKDAKLVVIGGGEDRKRIEELVRGDESIKLAGILPEDEKIRILRRSKILLSCSEFEGFGVPPIEALACGAVPVLSDIPAHREVIKNHGYIFSNVDDAVDEIVRLMADEKRRKKMARRGRVFVESNYTWSKVCDRFLDGISRWNG
ncbi:MAG: glycosyltransferase family 4 protein [Candidatus Hadarchaeales archaeon]